MVLSFGFGDGYNFADLEAVVGVNASDNFWDSLEVASSSFKNGEGDKNDSRAIFAGGVRGMWILLVISI